MRGSFTGAYRDKPGKLELAHEGTAFLDEVGEMTLRMQGLLLRFLETGELQRVGDDGGARRVNVRIVAATHRNLKDLVEQGTFREDLFYRLNVIHIEIPPLRERPADIPVLVEHFLQAFFDESSCVVRSIAPEAMHVLSQCQWPGNVRQLVNVVEQVTITCRETVATVIDLPADIRQPQGAAFKPKRERRRTVAVDLYKRLTEQHESFWASVFPMTWTHQITRETLRSGSSGSVGCARQLPDCGEPVQSPAAGLQALSQLPAKTRVPAAVQGIPAVSMRGADVKRFARCTIADHRNEETRSRSRCARASE